MNTNDFIRIRAYGTHLGVRFENIFHYRVTTAGSGSQAMNALATEFRTYYSNWAAIAHVTWICDAIETVNLNNTAEFGVDGSNITGTQGTDASDSCPSTIAVYAKLVRSTNATRDGYKYMNGLPKSRLQGNSIVQINNDINSYFSFVTAVLAPSGQGTYSPVICRFPKTGATSIPSAHSPIAGFDYRGYTVMNRRKR